MTGGATTPTFPIQSPTGTGFLGFDDNLSMGLATIQVSISNLATVILTGPGGPTWFEDLDAAINASGSGGLFNLLFAGTRNSLKDGRPVAVFARSQESMDVGGDDIRISVEIDIGDKSRFPPDSTHAFFYPPVLLLVEVPGVVEPIDWHYFRDPVTDFEFFQNQWGQAGFIDIGSQYSPLIFPDICTPDLSLIISGLVEDRGGCPCSAANGTHKLNLIGSSLIDGWHFNSAWDTDVFVPPIGPGSADFDAGGGRVGGLNNAEPDVLSGDAANVGFSSEARANLCSSILKSFFVDGVKTKQRFNDGIWSDLIIDGPLNSFGPCIWQGPSMTLVES